MRLGDAAAIAWRLRLAAVVSVAPRRHFARAKWTPHAAGVVSSVAGDRVVLSGLRHATVDALVALSRGGLALITDMRTDGTIHASLVCGTAARGEAAALHPTPPSLLVDFSFAGRALDPLGRPLDGLGRVGWGGVTARRQLLFPSGAGGGGTPSITERSPIFDAALPSGMKAIDAFYPLVRGRSHALTGERGVGKRELALGVVQAVARTNALLSRRRWGQLPQRAAGAAADTSTAPLGGGLEATHSGSSSDSSSGSSSYGINSRVRGGSDDIIDHSLSRDDDLEIPSPPPPVHCVYVSVGRSAGSLDGLLRALRRDGSSAYTTLVAAPPGSTPAMQFLAPFAGAAIAEFWRDAGRHALLVVDDLTTHYAAARQ